MNKSYLKRFVISLFLPVLLASCASSSVTGVWKDQNYTKPINKILVIALAKNQTNRRIFEDILSKDLITAGKDAVVSTKYFSEIIKLNKQSLRPLIKKEKFDKVIIARVVSVDKEQQYIASGYPSGYNSMYGYYGDVRAQYGSGGYYVQNTIVSLEFNLYETTNAKLIWALTTETFQPGDINKEAKGISKIIMEELKKEKLL